MVTLAKTMFKYIELDHVWDWQPGPHTMNLEFVVHPKIKQQHGGGRGGIWLFQMHSLGCLTALNFAWSVCPLMHLFFDGAPQIVEHASHGIDKEALEWYECEKTWWHLFFFLLFHFLVITYLKWYACGGKLSLIFVCTWNCVKCFRTCYCSIVHFWIREWW